MNEKDFAILVKMMLDNKAFVQGITEAQAKTEAAAKAIQEAQAKVAKAIQDAQAKTEQFHKAVQNMGDKVTNVFKNIASGMAAAFAFQKIVSFSEECIKLAANMEGIQTAFQKIAGATPAYMDKITKATRGAVSQFDLMKITVKAANFNVPLEKMPMLLQYATQYAMKTNQSITDLVENIVQGFGRKTPRSFITLGISMAEAKKSIKETGDMTAIIKEKLAAMGDVVDTNQIKIARMEANVMNVKIAWGEFLVNSDLVQTSLKGLTLTLEKLGNPNLDYWQKAMMSGKEYERWMKDHGQYLVVFQDPENIHNNSVDKGKSSKDNTTNSTNYDFKSTFVKSFLGAMLSPLSPNFLSSMKPALRNQNLNPIDVTEKTDQKVIAGAKNTETENSIEFYTREIARLEADNLTLTKKDNAKELWDNNQLIQKYEKSKKALEDYGLAVKEDTRLEDFLGKGLNQQAEEIKKVNDTAAALTVKYKANKDKVIEIEQARVDAIEKINNKFNNEAEKTLETALNKQAEEIRKAAEKEKRAEEELNNQKKSLVSIDLKIAENYKVAAYKDTLSNKIKALQDEGDAEKDANAELIVTDKLKNKELLDADIISWDEYLKNNKTYDAKLITLNGSTDAKITAQTKELLVANNKKYLGILESDFENAFNAMADAVKNHTSVWKAFGQAAMQAIEGIIIKLGAEIAAWAILKLVTKQGTGDLATYLGLNLGIGAAILAKTTATVASTVATRAAAAAASALAINEAVAAAAWIPFPLNLPAMTTSVAAAEGALGIGKLVAAATNAAVSSLGFAGLASGRFSTGAPTWVGENGPELVHLPSGSQAFSNSQSKNMMGGELHISGELVGRGSDLVAVLNNHNRQINSFR